MLVGSSGTHSVCVCTIHQNVNLMLSSVKLDKDHHELTDMLVCSRESKECMVHRCQECPNSSNLENYLSKELKPQNEDAATANESHIHFQQWVNVDRSELVSKILPISEFIALLVEKLHALTAHSYIASAQAKYLKKCKAELNENEIIVLGYDTLLRITSLLSRMKSRDSTGISNHAHCTLLFFIT